MFQTSLECMISCISHADESAIPCKVILRIKVVVTVCVDVVEVIKESIRVVMESICVTPLHKLAH